MSALIAVITLPCSEWIRPLSFQTACCSSSYTPVSPHRCPAPTNWWMFTETNCLLVVKPCPQAVGYYNVQFHRNRGLKREYSTMIIYIYRYAYVLALLYNMTGCWSKILKKKKKKKCCIFSQKLIIILGIIRALFHSLALIYVLPRCASAALHCTES